MYPQYTYMAGQQPQPQADPYLMGQPAVPQVAMLVLPPTSLHQVRTHPVGTHSAVHGQHYVYMSTTPPQSVPVPYTQAGQTPIRLETSATPPMPTTPQMTPKTPKSDKTNSDSEKDEQEHVTSKPSKKYSKDHDSDKEHDVSDNVFEQPEDIYLKITREHLNLLEVQKLLGYSTGPENKTDKEADITNVIQVPDEPQAQQQTVQMVQTVQQDQSQPVMVNPVAQVPQVSQPMMVTPLAQVPRVSQPMTVTSVAQVPQVSQMQLQQQVIPAPAPVQVTSASGSATATTSTEPEFHGQCSTILLPGGGSGHQAPKI